MKKISRFLLLFAIVLGMSYAKNIQMPIKGHAGDKSSSTMDLAQVQEVEVLVKNIGDPANIYIYGEKDVIDSLDENEEKRITLQVGVEYLAESQEDEYCGNGVSYFTPTAEEGQEWEIDFFYWSCDEEDPGFWTEEDYYYIKKVWKNDEGHLDQRPKEITVDVFCQYKNIGSPWLPYNFTVTLDEENDWEDEFSIPYDVDGSGGGGSKCKVEEHEVPPGYVATYPSTTLESGGTFTITNTYEGPVEKEIKVVKKWVDEENKYHTRPDEVVVELKNKDTVVQTATLNEENHWEYTFKVPEKDAEGNVIAYTIQEAEEIKGYTSKVDGYTITNTLIQEGKVPNTRDSKMNTMILFLVSIILLMVGYHFNKILRHS